MNSAVEEAVSLRDRSVQCIDYKMYKSNVQTFTPLLWGGVGGGAVHVIG
jgi:hypothetical protein